MEKILTKYKKHLKALQNDIKNSPHQDPVKNGWEHMLKTFIEELELLQPITSKSEEDKNFIRSLLPKWALFSIKGLSTTMYKTGTYEGDIKIINKINKILGINQTL